MKNFSLEEIFTFLFSKGFTYPTHNISNNVKILENDKRNIRFIFYCGHSCVEIEFYIKTDSMNKLLYSIRSDKQSEIIIWLEEIIKLNLYTEEFEKYYNNNV